MESKDLSLGSGARIVPWRFHVIIACLFFGNFLIGLDINIINVAIPHISSQFRALEDVAWYGSAYLLTITAFQPVYGWFYKYFQTDIVYRLSVVFLEIGSVLCATATGSNMFIVGRAVAGFGAAGILQGALSTISQIVPLSRRPLYMGVVISAFVVTVTAGPVLGGAFTQHVTWRWCFWINLPVGALVLLGLTVFLKISESPDDPKSQRWTAKLKRMDLLGCLLFLGTIVCLLLALQWGGQKKPWTSADVIGCFVGAGSLGLAFILWQWKVGDDALIPLRVFRQRSVWTGTLTLFFLGAQLNTNVFFLPFWFEGVKDYSPVSTGVNFIAMLTPQLIALVIVGIVVKQYGHYVPYMVVGEIIAIVGQSLFIRFQVGTSTVYWAAAMLVTGLGLGVAMQLPYTAIAVVLSDEDIPIGNAIAVLFWQLGGAIFISIGQTITLTTLYELVPEQLPNIAVETIINAGAANLRALAHDDRTWMALRSIWNVAVVRNMYLAIAALAASVPLTLGMEWLNAVKVAEAREMTREKEKPAGTPGEVGIAPV